jgi:hypothetical protein
MSIDHGAPPTIPTNLLKGEPALKFCTSCPDLFLKNIPQFHHLRVSVWSVDVGKQFK